MEKNRELHLTWDKVSLPEKPDGLQHLMTLEYAFNEVQCVRCGVVKGLVGPRQKLVPRKSDLLSLASNCLTQGVLDALK